MLGRAGGGLDKSGGSEHTLEARRVECDVLPRPATLAADFAEHRWDRRLSSSISLMLCGSVVIYALGLAWLRYDYSPSLSAALEDGLYPFVVGDTIKLFLAAALVPLAWRGVERLRGRQR